MGGPRFILVYSLLMKTIKFRPWLADLILSRQKTSTWRLFDDKELTEGDTVDFINWETREKFGEATLTSVVSKTLGELTPEDNDGHEVYASPEEMYQTLQEYYAEKVGPDSPLKVIKFTFQPI